MVGYFLVVEMPHARDKWRMAVLSGPVDRFFLRFEGAEHVVCVILQHKVFNGASLGTTLGTSCRKRLYAGRKRARRLAHSLAAPPITDFP
jgi:hypothetical protein